MKATFPAILAAVLALGACNNSQSGSKAPADSPSVVKNTPAGAKPVISFEKQVHHFGKIVAGEVVEYSFKFKNIGGSDLLITRAEASCGCTIPEWPKAPIRPGDSAYIQVKFDSKGRPEGYTEKEIFIEANTEPAANTGPRITAEIVAKK
ncbi:DUF1573 domain-containing protein [Chitinophaga rhizosphaerae]|uniref:DUF1573 domain-containing protein n=1 Tax=Chitinophaga rhizosphaerae TaxID=1864947 RepID=UPI000F7FAE9D|nr:DUF1573 domain-containing protein [Chitinophaga rhizosphaerae]